MEYLAYSAASWFIMLVCGLPFALIFLPRAHKAMVIPTAPLFGYSYIVLVTYIVFRSNVGGSDVFAPYVLVPPILLLGLLIWRYGIAVAFMLPRGARVMVGLSLLNFAIISLLFLLAGGRAVSMAISNLDIAELAAVARYMKEFAHNSGVGFLGQTGWFKATADIIWFGPSMITAMISTLTGSEPFRLQSIVQSLVASQGVIAVYAIARDALSLNRATSLIVGVLYATSPVLAYVIWQSFGGQMVSMALMLMIVYFIMSAEQTPPRLGTHMTYVPAMVLLFSALLVTYHFMIGIVCLLAAIYITILAVLERSWRRFFVGAAMMITTVIVTGILNPLRVPALIETLSMVKDSSNGWFIPWLSPDVQLGFGASKLLDGTGLRFQIVGIAVAVILTILLVSHLLDSRRTGRANHIAFVFGMALPTLLIGFYYAVTERQEVLGSYRSFKLTATFCAFTLIAYALWFGVRTLTKRSTATRVGAIIAALILFTNATGLFAMVRATSRTGYIPSEDLTKLQKIESLPNVHAIDIMKDDNFDMFWAQYFTLRKRQYFEEFPYGGRDIGALIAPYRLAPGPNKIGPAPTGDIFLTESQGCSEFYQLNKRMSLCRPLPNKDVTVTPGKGWWDKETSLRWSGRDGRIADVFVETKAPTVARIRTFLSPSADGMKMEVNGAKVPIKMTRTGFVSDRVMLHSGKNIVRFVSPRDPSPGSASDRRALGYIWKLVLVELPQLSSSRP